MNSVSHPSQKILKDFFGFFLVDEEEEMLSPPVLVEDVVDDLFGLFLEALVEEDMYL